MKSERITITIDQDLLAWIDQRISGKKFANRSHALEYVCLQKMQENKRKDGKEGREEGEP